MSRAPEVERVRALVADEVQGLAAVLSRVALLIRGGRDAEAGELLEHVADALECLGDGSDLWGAALVLAEWRARRERQGQASGLVLRQLGEKDVP